MIDYEMFSEAGNIACRAMVEETTKRILSKERLTSKEVQEMYENGMSKINREHNEVWDTEPRGHIAHNISQALKQAGYAFRINFWGDIVENQCN